MKASKIKNGPLYIGLIFSINILIGVSFTNCSRGVSDKLDLSANSGLVDSDTELRALSSGTIVPPENLKSLNISKDLKLLSEQAGDKSVGKDGCGLTADAIKSIPDSGETPIVDVNPNNLEEDSRPDTTYDVKHVQNFSCWPQWNYSNITDGDISLSNQNKKYANIFTIWQDGKTFYIIVKNNFFFKKYGNDYYLNSPRLNNNGRARTMIKLFTVYDTNLEAATDKKFGITNQEYRKLANCTESICVNFDNIKSANHLIAIRSMMNIAKFYFFVFQKLPGGLQIRDAVKSGIAQSTTNLVNIDDFASYFKPMIENTITLLSSAMLDGWLPFEQIDDKFYYRGALFFGNTDSISIKKEWALCGKGLSEANTNPSITKMKIEQCVSEILLASYKDHSANNLQLSALTDQSKFKKEVISRLTPGLFSFSLSGVSNNNASAYHKWLEARWEICSYYADGTSSYAREKLRNLYSCLLQPSLVFNKSFNTETFKKTLVQNFVDSNYYLYKLGDSRNSLALKLKVGDSIRIQFKDPGFVVRDLFVDKVQLYCRVKNSDQYSLASIWTSHPSMSDEFQFINKQDTFTKDPYVNNYEKGTSVGVYDNFSSTYDGFCHLEFTFLNDAFHNADGSPIVIKSKELPLTIIN